jgi:tRNA1Val (adenine37-N6)-methyltransferase
MQKYSQPEEYHFSRNSIELVNFAIKHLHSKPLKVLDLCSGCGVVGIEYYLKTNSQALFTFIELQANIFKSHLDANIQKSNIQLDRAYYCDFRDLDLNRSFDLILCNPPYFKAEQARLGNNQVKSICTHFNANFFEDLIGFISKSLSQNGKSFILCRKDFLPRDTLEKWKDQIKIEELDNKTDVIILDQTGYIDS